MRGTTVLSHLCLLVAGVFTGVWMLWSAPNPRDIKFVVEPYPMANLQVAPGDRITLVDGTGNNIDWTLKFVGTVPCARGIVDPCVLNSKLGSGSYFFYCTSTSVPGNGCPDPGIQPSPSNIMRSPRRPGYFAALARAFRIGGGQNTPVKTGAPAQGKVATAPAGANPPAVVSCDTSTDPKGVSIVQSVDGRDLTTITASDGETVYWTSSDPFTLVPINYSNNFCGPDPPKVDSTGLNAKCTVGANLPSKSTMNYTVTATNTATGQSCGPSQGTNVTIQ